MTDDLLDRIRTELSYAHDLDRLRGTLAEDHSTARAIGWYAVGIAKSCLRGAALGALGGGLLDLVGAGDGTLWFTAGCAGGTIDALGLYLRANAVSKRQYAQDQEPRAG